MSDFLQYSQIFRVSVDEVDYLERLKPSAVLQYFQDIATEHANEMGIGYDKMKEDNVCWVLSRLSYEILEYPMIGEEIKVTTFPRKPNLVDTIRDFYIYDSFGDVAIKGTSRWCLVDIEKRKVKKCAGYFDFNELMYCDRNAMADGNLKLPPIETSGTNGNFATMSERVRLTDLDRNFHMNNARYGDIIYNACDIVKHNSEAIKRVDFNYLSELTYPQQFVIIKNDVGEDSYFEARKQDDTVAFRARINWSKDDR